jgi:hypothetical protein
MRQMVMPRPLSFLPVAGRPLPSPVFVPSPTPENGDEVSVDEHLVDLHPQVGESGPPTSRRLLVLLQPDVSRGAVVDEVLSSVDLVGDLELALVEDLLEDPSGDCLALLRRLGRHGGGERHDAENDKKCGFSHWSPSAGHTRFRPCLFYPRPRSEP